MEDRIKNDPLRVPTVHEIVNRSNSVLIAEKPIAEKPTPEEIKALVDQIHDEFNTAGDKLLVEAKDLLKSLSEKNLEKGQLLASLGFNATPQAKEAAQDLVKKKEAEELAALIVDYHFKYPNNKFITEEKVQEICEKYNLVCGNVGLYKGFVPAKNLKEIADFKLKQEDEVYVRNQPGLFGFNTYILSRKEMEEYASNGLKDRTMTEIALQGSIQRVGFEICAPIADMDTTGKVQQGHRLVDAPKAWDPVVLQPLMRGALIVTAWGDEASDPIVVNEKMN